MSLQLAVTAVSSPSEIVTGSTFTTGVGRTLSPAEISSLQASFVMLTGPVG